MKEPRATGRTWSLYPLAGDRPSPPAPARCSSRRARCRNPKQREGWCSQERALTPWRAGLRPHWAQWSHPWGLGWGWRGWWQVEGSLRPHLPPPRSPDLCPTGTRCLGQCASHPQGLQCFWKGPPNTTGDPTVAGEACPVPSWGTPVDLGGPVLEMPSPAPAHLFLSCSVFTQEGLPDSQLYQHLDLGLPSLQRWKVDVVYKPSS